MGRYHYMPSHFCQTCKKNTHAIDQNHGYDLNAVEPNKLIWVCAKCKVPFENIPKCGYWKGMYGGRSEGIDEEVRNHIYTLQSHHCPQGYDFGDDHSRHPECKNCRISDRCQEHWFYNLPEDE